MLELDEHLERKPANLSGGQRQRVAMGRAIVRQADAFLFDEPLSNLDAKLRGQMRTEIARMQRRLGITTVYVTHDQTEAMTLGDRVAVLKKGIVQQCASPRELYDQPVNLFVAGFIGSPPMNFLPARVDGTTLRLPFVDVPMTPDLAAKVKGLDIVICGVRPEHLKDASLGDAEAEGTVSFTAPVDVTEWLGNEQYAYIPFEADPAVKAQLDELDRELDGEGMRTQIGGQPRCPVTDPRGRRHAAELQPSADARLRPQLRRLPDPRRGEGGRAGAGERSRPQAGAGAGPRPGGRPWPADLQHR